MKNVIFVGLLFLVSIQSFAQTDSLVSYSGIELIPGATKDELYVRARQWFNETFKSSKAVLQVADRETGDLSGKGWFYSGMRMKELGGPWITQQYPVDVMVNIRVKDGKYRYEFARFYHRTSLDPLDATGFGYITKDSTTKTKWMFYNRQKMNAMYVSAKEGIYNEVVKLVTSLDIALRKKDDF